MPVTRHISKTLKLRNALRNQKTQGVQHGKGGKTTHLKYIRKYPPDCSSQLNVHTGKIWEVGQGAKPLRLYFYFTAIKYK